MCCFLLVIFITLQQLLCFVFIVALLFLLWFLMGCYLPWHARTGVFIKKQNAIVAMGQKNDIMMIRSVDQKRARTVQIVISCNSHALAVILS